MRRRLGRNHVSLLKVDDFLKLIDILKIISLDVLTDGKEKRTGLTHQRNIRRDKALISVL